MRFKFKFSIRTLFIILTVVSIVLGLRYQRRVRIQIASNKIKEMGGEVFLACQEPRLFTYQSPIGPMIFHTNRNLPMMATLNQVHLAKPKQQRSPIIAFLFGATDDVEVFAVAISATSVNDETVRLLQKLGGVEVVLLHVSADYLRIKHATRITEESRERNLERLGKDFRRAKDLIEHAIPGVAIYQGETDESVPKAPRLFIANPTGDKIDYPLDW